LGGKRDFFFERKKKKKDLKAFETRDLARKKSAEKKASP